MPMTNCAILGRLDDADSEVEAACQRWGRLGVLPPRHRFLDRVLDACSSDDPLPVAVAMPMSDVALRGALEAARAGLISPLLVAPEAELRRAAAQFGIDLSGFELVSALDGPDAARKCAALCRTGRARAIMKGSLETDVLMHELVRGEAGLRTARRMSHIFLLDVPSYPRPLLITDAAINIRPSLEEKVDIVQNAIELAQRLGIVTPHVALLSAVETVHSKIQATVDAAALSKMAERGQIHGAVVDGPLAFDTAVSAQAAAIKHLVSPVAGVADILVAPDLESGNLLVKQLEYLGGAELAGLVLGASVPIILTSRADSARARLVSCAIATLVASGRTADLASASNR